MMFGFFDKIAIQRKTFFLLIDSMDEEPRIPLKLYQRESQGGTKLHCLEGRKTFCNNRMREKGPWRTKACKDITYFISNNKTNAHQIIIRTNCNLPIKFDIPCGWRGPAARTKSLNLLDGICSCQERLELVPCGGKKSLWGLESLSKYKFVASKPYVTHNQSNKSLITLLQSFHEERP